MTIFVTIQMQFIPHRKHITSPLQSPTGYCCLGKQSLFIVRTVREHTDTLCGQNAEFWYVNAGGSYSNHWTLKRRFILPLLTKVGRISGRNCRQDDVNVRGLLQEKLLRPRSCSCWRECVSCTPYDPFRAPCCINI
jgi:hypothetical protein